MAAGLAPNGDDSNDADVDGRGKSVWCFGMGGRVGDGHAAYNCDGSLNGGFCGKFESDLHCSEGFGNVC